MREALDRLESLFTAALQQPAADRAAYLDHACANDQILRRRVENLLQAQAAAGSFLEPPTPIPVVTADELPVLEQPGAKIGPYKLLEEIGEGGFGVIFLAEQMQPVRRKVALKILKPGMDTRQVVARFEAERQALAIMDHPNIARVFDGGATESGRPYFVMELVKGVPITDFCDHDLMTARQRLELFIPVCQAVQHAHQKGIIHRDLKPSNVLVSRYDTTPVVKVIDFGVAKALGQELTDKTLFTGVAQMVGTPLYMSPEQAGMSDLDVDTRSDIYSLGVLLYELLTGTTPFDKERFKRSSYDEIRRIIREEEPARPSTRLSTLGQNAATVSARGENDPRALRRLFRGELDWIVMKALEKDRTRRYETASAFAADIERFLADEPVLACPPSAAYRLRKFARRNRGPVLAVILVFLALLGGGIGVTHGLIQAWKHRELTTLWQQAEAAREQAELARDGEAKARQEAEAAREKLAVVEYGRSIQVAHQEWRDKNVVAALSLLDSTRADLRGWEWRYVHHLCNSHLVRFEGHTADVYSASFSPDGARVVTAGVDRLARIWDAKNGVALRTLRGHTGKVFSASFSADGKRIVTASDDANARVWDVQTGAEILSLHGHTGSLMSALFSPDGARIVTASYDGTARVWDTRAGAQLLVLRGHTAPVLAASFSPDGSRLVTASEDRTVRLWDAKTGAAVRTLRGHTAPVWSVSFSPDGTRLVSAGVDQTARIWDARTGAMLLTLRGHTSVVWSASFSPDGSRVATASYDRTARVWDAETGAPLLTLLGHTNSVRSVCFNADGARLLTASEDRTARIWDAKTGAENLALQGHAGLVRPATFSPDGMRLVTGSADRTARVWDARTGTTLLTLRGHTGAVLAASFSPDGARLVTASEDKTARVWDARTGTTRLTLAGHTAATWSASFSRDGRRIVTGSDDGTSKVWDAESGVVVFTLMHRGSVRSASFSPDGSRLVTACGDRTARVWDADTGEAILTLRGHSGPVVSASFSPDGSRLVTASADQTARIWDANTGAGLLILRAHTSFVFGASFSPDGSRVVTVSYDRTARLWDAHTGAAVLSLKHAAGVLSASFSPDGSRLATTSANTAWIWDAPPLRKAQGIAPAIRKPMASPPKRNPAPVLSGR